jgi:DNA-binding transcriptional MerR regulator
MAFFPCNNIETIDRNSQKDIGNFHAFSIEEFSVPSSCFLCNEAIWGLQITGLRCSGCQLSIHQQCLDKANPKQLKTCGLSIEEIRRYLDVNSNGFEIKLSDTLERRKPVANMSAETLMRLSRQNYPATENITFEFQISLFITSRISQFKMDNNLDFSFFNILPPGVQNKPLPGSSFLFINNT